MIEDRTYQDATYPLGVKIRMLLVLPLERASRPTYSLGKGTTCALQREDDHALAEEFHLYFQNHVRNQVSVAKVIPLAKHADLVCL